MDYYIVTNVNSVWKLCKRSSLKEFGIFLLIPLPTDYKLLS